MPRQSEQHGRDAHAVLRASAAAPRSCRSVNAQAPEPLHLGWQELQELTSSRTMTNDRRIIYASVHLHDRFASPPLHTCRARKRSEISDDENPRISILSNQCLAHSSSKRAMNDEHLHSNRSRVAALCVEKERLLKSSTPRNK